MALLLHSSGDVLTRRSGQRVTVAMRTSTNGVAVSCRNTAIAREFESQIARWQRIAPGLSIAVLIDRAMVCASIAAVSPRELPDGEALHASAHPAWSERQCAERALMEAECARRRRRR